MKHQGIFAANEGKQHRFMPPWIQTGWQSRVALIAGLLTLGVLGGAAIPILGVLAPAAIIGLLCTLALPVIWLTASEKQMGTICVVLLFLSLIQDIPNKIIGTSLSAPLQLVMMALAPAGLVHFLSAARQDKILRASLIAFFAFIGISVLSSALGRSNATAAAYQLISNLKPLLLIALFFAPSWGNESENRFIFILKIAAIPLAALAVFEWAAPGLYANIFPTSFTTIASSEGLPRATGNFRFTGHFAAVTAQIALLFLLSHIHRQDIRRFDNLVYAFIYAACLATTLSKGEIISFAACSAMIFVFHKKSGVIKRIAISAATLLIASIGFIILFGDSISRELELAGITRTVGEIDHPRMQIYSYGMLIAAKYFPLGAGLGTYAGAGAEKFDQSLYDLLGFQRFWWYGKQDFLMDTYWPNPIAESGYIGAIFALSSYILLFIYALKNWTSAQSHAAPYWGAAATGMLFSLINSLSTPSFVEAKTFFFVAIFFGIAHKKSANSKPKHSPPEKYQTN